MVNEMEKADGKTIEIIIYLHLMSACKFGDTVHMKTLHATHSIKHVNTDRYQLTSVSAMIG